VAFSPALPVGVESHAEYIDLWLSKTVEETEIAERLNAVLPEGLSAICARQVPLNASSLEQSIVWMEYEITFPDGKSEGPSQEELEQTMEAFYNGKFAGERATDEEHLRRSVRLGGIHSGHGLVCRIHRLSGSMPSAMRVVKTLFPSLYGNGLLPRIRKTETALLTPCPPALTLRRNLCHDK
jgi:hypothetical protein